MKRLFPNMANGLFLRVSYIAFMAALAFSSQAQVLVNEIQVTNDATLADEDGDYEDWIELYNSGSSPVSLLGWSLSDDPSDPEKWPVPDIVLPPSERQLIFASGKNRAFINPVDHFETPFYPWSNFTYLLPVAEPSAEWRLPGFDTSGWSQGIGSIGTGDDDDGTDIGSGYTSVYSRITINFSDVNAVEAMYFFADYDDAFVAWLNGVEIARSGIGVQGIPPTFDQLSDINHEANGYQGLDYDGFLIEPAVFQSALVNGENVFSFQVHNYDAWSSDMTGNFIVAIAMNTEEIQTEIAPEWANLTVEESNLHTNFKMSQGEHLYLSSNGNAADVVVLPEMQLGHSYQRSGDGNWIWCISDEPTPGAPNSTNCKTSYATAPYFSLDAGVFSGSVNVALAADNPEWEIRFTMDGSMPDTSSSLYSVPLVLDQTMTISARCFGSEVLASPVEKNTYLINEDAIDIPIVSLSVNPDYLWDPETGIHVYGPPDYELDYPYFGANFWENWEREAYIEYFDQDHVKQFEGGVGLKIHGGWSRGNEQKSFRIQCKDEYGLESMDYPLIQDKPFITSYKGFNLRNGGNDYWGYRFHDALMERSMRETNADYMAYSPVIVFLNGEYWGFMELREILDQHWAENNHGVNNNDASVISYKGDIHVISGSDTALYPMYDYITGTDPLSPEFFDSVSTMLDIENYADYIIAETYWCNGDWSSGWSNNTKFWHNDNPGGKWRFMLMDMDFGMGLAGAGPYDNYISEAGDDWYHTDQIFNRMIQNPQFREYFITRYADLINTSFQASRINAMAGAMKDEISSVFQRHCARWGTDATSIDWVLLYRLYWNQLRVQGARDVVQQEFDLANQLTLSFDIQPAGAGRIHINTIEPKEEEYPWSGVYFHGVPVEITVIENPGFQFDHWGINNLFSVENNLRQFSFDFTGNDAFVAYFTGAPVDTALQVTEFMYNDEPANDGGDWIELHNLLEIPLNLSGMTFKDDNYFHRYHLPLNTFLAPDEYAILSSDTNLFLSKYPDTINVLGVFDFKLNNSGDRIQIHNHRNEDLVSFYYSDESPWPGNTDGTGRSAEFDTTYTDQELPYAWMNGCIGGSPGAPYDPNCGNLTMIENVFRDEWSLWPNPAGEMFFLYNNNGTIESIRILDVTGKVIHQQNAVEENICRVDCSDWERGMYFISAISFDGEYCVRKLVLR
ncbi:MAG: CotH kinase family protein [Crocinitomicaceae bacterium]|nr:CotH kinase family protein [Crocinitomicaceae bacterium]